MLAKELYPTNFKPTLSHYFIRLLAEKGLLLRNFTQNIDGLERRAGLNPDLLVESHGGFSTAHCIDCGHQYSEQFVKDCVFRDEIPRCTRETCRDTKTATEEAEKKKGGGEGEEGEEGEGEEGEGGEVKGLVKPDIIFFGEALPDRFATCIKEDMIKCDLLIVMGTSLLVHPFASLVDRVRDDCPRLLINREKVGEGDVMMRLMGFSSGLDFGEETGYRDVFHKANCDDGCRDLADMLGWKAELEEMVAREHAKLDDQQTQ
ncbi:NAD-dependent protein deacetylase sirtuin-2 [Geodia barretti]|nr:NAD-dependent protein deacetylase sirtuin-2 [Geodia barretti]